MITQQKTSIGHAGLSPEELQAILRRAHQERKQAIGEFFAWLFSRRSAIHEPPRHLAHVKLSACR